MSQVTCLSIFSYTTIADKFWAFGMMQFAHGYLSGVEGLQFYKLMGSGKGFGFNPWPDWGTYALLTVWESREYADQFMQTSELMSKYKAHVDKLSTVFLQPIRAHGTWGGKQPFTVGAGVSDDGYIAALTRAQIKVSKLRTFWKYVPHSFKPLIDNNDLLYTKGIGEVPIINMATFSIWRDAKSIDDFAYKSRAHSKAITMTKQLDWYKEEMFVRFRVLDIVGDLLALDASDSVHETKSS